MAWNSRSSALVAGFCGLFGLASILPAALAQTDSPVAISYQENIKPIVDRKCSGCHVNGGHAGGLQLDSFQSMMRGGDDGPVVALGDLDGSQISKAIHYQDSDLKMPPENRGKLDDADIAAIDKWIKASALPVGVVSIEPAEAPRTTQPAAVSSATKATPVSETVSPATPMLAAEQEQFFETKVRPILINKCYTCHASAAKGGLRLDSRTSLLAGGKDGDGRCTRTS